MARRRQRGRRWAAGLAALWVAACRLPGESALALTDPSPVGGGLAPDRPTSGQGEQPTVAPDANVAPPYKGLLGRVDWVGIIGTGQSLSVGWTACDVVDGLPGIGNNLQLTDASGAYDLQDANALSLGVGPLKEPLRPCQGGGAYPDNIAGESPHTAMGQQMTVDARAAGHPQPVSVHTATGLGGQPMSVIGRGGSGNAYAAGLFETTALTRLAGLEGKTFAVGAVVLTHGEADAANPNYASDLLSLWSAYTSDVPAITGQSARIPLIITQQATFPPSNSGPAASMLAQWQAALAHPGDIVLAGPKTQYAYSADNIHLPSTGYRRMGIKYAQVFAAVVERGLPWRPLEPVSVSRSGPQTLDIVFYVPAPPLTWDTAQPPVHESQHTAWQSGHGFEVLDANGGELTIASATILADANTVRLELAQPAAGPLTVQYALTQDVEGQFQGGQAGGRIGHLRDSDDYQGFDQTTLTCTVTKGSVEVTCDSGLAGRGIYDVVSPGLAQIVGLPSSTTCTLSSPWAGASGPQALTFRSNQYNYCVTFQLPVP